MSSETLNHTGSFSSLAGGAGSHRIPFPAHTAGPRRTPAQPPASFLAAALATVQLWAERFRQRRALMAMEDRMLEDIGISRAEANREYRKPFWRA